MGLSYRWIKDVGPGPQGWENAQGLDFPFYVTNFSIISVSQGKTNSGIELLGCLLSVVPMCDSTGYHLRRHLLRNKCCEEIHLRGSTDLKVVVLEMSLHVTPDTVPKSHPPFAWGKQVLLVCGHPKEFLRVRKLTRNCAVGQWASAPSGLGVEEELRKCL